MPKTKPGDDLLGTIVTTACSVRVVLTESTQGGTIGAYHIERCLPGEDRWVKYASGVYSTERRDALVAQVVEALHSIPVPLPFD